MPRANKSTFLVLGLLADEPKSGYDIKRAVEDVIGHFWKESYGQIYPVLERLVRQGLIKKGSSPSGGRRRHVYSITAKGRAELERWLRTPPEPETVRNELLLKLFFGYRLPPGVLVGHIKGARARARAFEQFLLEGEREIADSDYPERARLAWGMTIRLGLLVSRARQQWADEAIALLER